MNKETTFWVTNGFGHNTQQPFVQVLIERADFVTQMSPANARELALNLLEAAEAAESDGFLITFLRKNIKVNDGHAIALVLLEFRKWRDAQRSGSETIEGQ